MDDPKTISFSMELLILSEDALAVWEDPESPSPVTERAATKRVAAKGTNQNLMPIYWLKNRIFLLVDFVRLSIFE
jgi:hypothetical protein